MRLVIYDFLPRGLVLQWLLAVMRNMLQIYVRSQFCHNQTVIFIIYDWLFLCAEKCMSEWDRAIYCLQMPTVDINIFIIIIICGIARHVVFRSPFCYIIQHLQE